MFTGNCGSSDRDDRVTEAKRPGRRSFGYGDHRDITGL